jgi:hypothetical protein
MCQYNFGQKHLSIKVVTLRYLKPQAPCSTFGTRFKSSQWIGVHQGGFIKLRPMV